MDRNYITDIVMDPWGEGSYCPVTVFFPSFSVSAPMPGDPNTGIPYMPWVLVAVTQADAAELAAFEADARVDVLPDYPQATPVAQMSTASLASLRAILTKRGIGAGLVDEAPSYGTILAGIALRANSPSVTPASATLVL